MDAKTLEALQESIRHWEDLVINPLGKIGAMVCPLCQLYNNTRYKCRGCPVYGRTGQRSCAGTPYHAFTRERTSQNAQRELDFLRSLLPQPVQEEKPKEIFRWVDLAALG